jgi:hypothetical protein
MFNVLAISAPRQTDIHNHHHEHRAPTDQSVALLREMEAAALGRVLHSGRLESNSFNCEWKVMRDDHAMTATAVCRFDLNGEEHTVTVPIAIGMSRSREAMAETILAAVQRKVAMQLTLPLFMSAITREALAR